MNLPVDDKARVGKPLIDMKQVTSFTRVVVLAVSALLVTGANQTANAAEYETIHVREQTVATGMTDGGRLIIKPSPTLGYDIGITITIDGKLSGSLVRGQSYDRYISPGRHVVVASPNHLGDDARVVLDIQRGQTYCYVASYSVRQARLERARQCP